METIVINNFGGRLTRLINGDLNSGFAKFDTSFGYDPFTKPMNLTWLAQPTSVGGIATNQLVVGGLNSAGFIGFDNESTTFVVTNGPPQGARVWKIDIGESAGVSFTSVISSQSIVGQPLYGASLARFGNGPDLYVSTGQNIQVVGSVATSGTVNLTGRVSVIGNSSYMPATFHPLKVFAGNLVFGNGPTIGVIDSTGNINSSVFVINDLNGAQYSELFPPLPSNQNVHNLEVSNDNNYILLPASEYQNEDLTFSDRRSKVASPMKGAVYAWNGIDETVTAATTIPAGVSTSVKEYLQERYLFFTDAFGAAVGTINRKIFTLSNNRIPSPNAVDINGNFVTWMAPEVINDNQDRVGSLYYYGSLDEETPVGLYRLLRFTSALADGQIAQVPYQALVSNAFRSNNSTESSVISITYGQHLFSAHNVNPVIGDFSVLGSASFMKFNVTSAPNFEPQLGVYETQTQMFPKRIHIDQVRIYTESTVANNGFQLDIVGVDGDSIYTGNYSFVAGSDITKMQGALQRINFNPNADAGYGFGIRITNTGTTNMVIKKIEVDVSPEGR